MTYELENQNVDKTQKEKMEKVAINFMNAFLSMSVNANTNELAETFFTDYKKEFSKQQDLNKFELFFSSYKTISSSNFTIESIDFDCINNKEGYGVIEGNINFSAILTTNETVNIDSFYRLFVIYQPTDWKIFFFKIPGFIW